MSKTKLELLTHYIADCVSARTSSQARMVTVCKGGGGRIIGGCENLVTFYVEDESGREFSVSVRALEKREEVAPATLTELMDAVVDGRVELTDDMPSFGGEEPDCTAEVWSWDATHLLVGTHAGDLAIVTREHHAAEILQQRAEAMHEDRELAEKAEWS
ncbi:MAG: hypothetical protein ACTSX8_02495 [Alphaproteobacteria bacterium]